MIKKQKCYSKAKNVKKMPKKLKIFSLKYTKVFEFKKKTFLNKGSKHKKNYTEGQN